MAKLIFSCVLLLALASAVQMQDNSYLNLPTGNLPSQLPNMQLPNGFNQLGAQGGIFDTLRQLPSRGLQMVNNALNNVRNMFSGLGRNGQGLNNMMPNLNNMIPSQQQQGNLPNLPNLPNLDSITNPINNAANQLTNQLNQVPVLGQLTSQLPNPSQLTNQLSNPGQLANRLTDSVSSMTRSLTNGLNLPAVNV